jgi:hypothetical protein
MKEINRPVVVSANWGNEDRHCALAVTTWNRIISGFKVVRTEKYFSEGQLFKSNWEFNLNGAYTVHVTYSIENSNLAEGLGFDGKLSELSVTYLDKKIPQLTKLIKVGRLYKKFEIYYEELSLDDSSQALLIVYLSKKQPGHLLNFVMKSPMGHVHSEINFKDIQTAHEFLENLFNGWNQLFKTNPPLPALKQILKSIESKDTQLASLIIEEPSLNHAQTLFEWN